jgi:hypothetical protein
MRAALYLPCALLLGAAIHAQEAKTSAQTAAQSPPQPPPSQQSPLGQDPSPADALEAQVSAVQQQVVPLAEEPHHQLLLRNDLVHVYSVSVPPLDSTLIHRHDLPYLTVSIGAANAENAVVGKPPVRVVLQDGQVTYSTGGFAHAVRTDAGVVFHNVTIELAKPQGEARNLCRQIVPGPLACPAQAAGGQQNAKSPAADGDIPYLETDEVRVDLFQVSGGHDYVNETPKQSCLLVALTNANLDANLDGQHSSFLHAGDILWLPIGVHRKVVDFLGTRSNFLLVCFKDSAAGAHP